MRFDPDAGRITHLNVAILNQHPRRISAKRAIRIGRGLVHPKSQAGDRIER